MLDVKLIKYSRNAATGSKLATFLVLDAPKALVLFDITRHRTFSFSVESSRAIPGHRVTDRLRRNLYIPEWAKNQAGMGEGDPLEQREASIATHLWQLTAGFCADINDKLTELGVHKQWANRVTDWISPINFVVSTTDVGFLNAMDLRLPYGVQPEVRKIAHQMNRLWLNVKPEDLRPGEWHLPFVREEEVDLSLEDQLVIATARCARASYGRTGEIMTLDKDRELVLKRLAPSKHWSPFEHCARAISSDAAYERRLNYARTNSLQYISNFDSSWVQWRKELE